MITPALLQAYLACPTKCYLQELGEKCCSNEYASWSKTSQESYRIASIERLTSSSSEGVINDQIELKRVNAGDWQVAFNQVVEAEGLSTNIHAIQQTPKKTGQFDLIPVRFVHTNKLSRIDKFAIAFDALVLSKATRKPVHLGKIIHGKSWTTTKIQIAGLHRELARTISKIGALLAGGSPPELILNRHCRECDFRDRCWAKAIDKDDLSLLTGMTDKERTRLNKRGIFTVTQLAYTFRPRRRSKRQVALPEKYHHSLRALALREKRIHVTGSPSVQVRGTPVFFDVESIPDRDFYYLIGVRIEATDGLTVHSFWANSIEEERTIWIDFLAFISTLEMPTLVHYGSFEAKFLKTMCFRYGPPPSGSSVAEAIATPLNLLSAIFAVVYLPTYSNGLKENARYLGFVWTDKDADGLRTIAWRHRWEQTNEQTMREKLITYNMEDCAALGLLFRVLAQLNDGQQNPADAQLPWTDVVQADTVRPRTSQWTPFKSPISDLELINHAARWKYQRDRILVRSARIRKRVVQSFTSRPQLRRAQKLIRLQPAVTCPNCHKAARKKGRLATRTVHDLIFGRNSIRRRVVQYTAQTYVCRSCGHEWGLNHLNLHGRYWGWNLVSYFIYHVIGLRIPQLTLQHSMNRLFGCRLVRSSLNEFKGRASTRYLETKKEILSRIINGNVIHADETSANIKGKAAYVWVLTSLTEVVYILTESREGETIRKLLQEFKGVLVSDFYAAYDSIKCVQQKCLIHLIRDLNDQILDNPFDNEVKAVAHRFGAVLRNIVETIDRRGLKAHFLRKHFRDVDRFYRFLNETEFKSEAADKAKQRFNKNRDKLFTFLQYDDVPWNNNNAEHAVKAFARLRDIILGSSTKKGVEEYLTLLTISETCKYRSIDFLDFLRSGETKLASFVSGQRSACQ
jgi:predicted RecB family nuclease